MDEKGDEMAKMTVYHGGYMAVEHPEIRKGRNTKDFGTGFYCTIIKEQAQRCQNVMILRLFLFMMCV